MVRIEELRVGMSLQPDREASPRAGRQVYLVRVEEHGVGVSVQPDGTTRKVGAGARPRHTTKQNSRPERGKPC